MTVSVFQVSGSGSEWHPAMQSDGIRSRESGTLLYGVEKTGRFIQLLSLQLLYGDAISYDVIGTATPFLYVPRLIQLYFLSVKKGTLSGPQINIGLGLFIIHHKGFFHLALTKVTLVPPCQSVCNVYPFKLFSRSYRHTTQFLFIINHICSSSIG